jgi:hypothetical protein
MTNRMTQIRDAARKIKHLQRAHVALDALAHDENELSDMRLHARDASAIDAMSDDSGAFHAAMREYHAR